MMFSRLAAEDEYMGETLIHVQFPNKVGLGPNWDFITVLILLLSVAPHGSPNIPDGIMLVNHRIGLPSSDFRHL
jgi:hypothetical protein